MKSLSSPVLWPSQLTPSSEVPAINDLTANLQGVVFNVEAWASALRLYDFTTGAAEIGGRDARTWKFIAAHECVLQLHHLRVRMENIGGLKLKKCASLMDSFDADRMRAARKALDQHFPHIDMLRHAIAHTGLTETDPQGHVPDGPYGMVGFSEPRNFSAPYRGSVRFLNITAESLERITEVAAHFLSAFVAAAERLEREGHVD